MENKLVRIKCEDCRHNDYCAWPAFSCEFPAIEAERSEQDE